MRIDEIIEELNGWRIEGFNNHEQISNNVGYISTYFPYYPELKLKILKKRDGKPAIKDSERRFWNAIRIYCYSLFENIWYGYLLSYSKKHNSTFIINNNPITFQNPSNNHLPSFSAGVMHFGTCRDLFFILLRLLNNPTSFNSEENLYKLMGFSPGKQYRYNNLAKFKQGIALLSSDADYMNLAELFHKNNLFRNYYAHCLRILWWHNHKCSALEYLYERKLYDSLINKNEHFVKNYLFQMFLSPAEYEDRISKSKCEDLISSREILTSIHDDIATFLNQSFGYIINLPDPAI